MKGLKHVCSILDLWINCQLCTVRSYSRIQLGTIESYSRSEKKERVMYLQSLATLLLALPSKPLSFTLSTLTRYTIKVLNASFRFSIMFLTSLHFLVSHYRGRRIFFPFHGWAFIPSPMGPLGKVSSGARDSPPGWGAGKPTRLLVIARVVKGSEATTGRTPAAGGVESTGSWLVAKGSRVSGGPTWRSVARGWWRSIASSARARRSGAV